MNKFNFICEEKNNQQDIHKKEEKVFCEFEHNFKFIFSAQNSRQLNTQIVKSDISENVLEQINQMFSIINKENKVSFFKMNFQTKMKFRMYFEYSVDIIHIKEINNLKVSGNLRGIPIILDEDIDNNCIIPFYEIEKNNNKLKLILN